MNDNPILSEDPLDAQDFFIPQEFKDKTLYITTKTRLLREGWTLHLIHGLSVNGRPQEFDPKPDIERKEIGKCRDVDGYTFYLTTKVSRFNNGGGGEPPLIEYTIKFEADDEIIDLEFTLKSTERNPFTYYTFITLKLEK